jgi:hypothetical protein
MERPEAQAELVRTRRPATPAVTLRRCGLRPLPKLGTARVMALAAAGQVLVSGTVKDLVVGSSIQFADHGSHQLEGIPGEWRLFEATWLS